MRNGRESSKQVMAEPLECRRMLSGTTYDFGKLLGYGLAGHSWTYESDYKIKTTTGSGRTSAGRGAGGERSWHTNDPGNASGSGEATVSVARQGSASAGVFKVRTSGASGQGTVMIVRKAGSSMDVGEIDATGPAANLKLHLENTHLAPQKLALSKNYTDGGTFNGKFNGIGGGNTISGTVSGTSAASFKLLSNQTITTPAGSFQAVKGTYQVKLSGTMHVKVNGQSVNVAFSASYPTTFWAVQDIGIVKLDGTMTTSLSAMGEHATSTLHATSVLNDFTPHVGVFKAFVDQPGAGGDRDVFEGTPEQPDLGSAWWEIDVPPAMVKRLPADLRQFVNHEVGYVPQAGSQLTSGPGALGLIASDSNFVPTVQGHWSIGWAGLIAGLRYTQQLSQTPGTFDLQTFNENDAVIEAANAAGIEVPRTEGSYAGLNLDFSAADAGDLGEDLVEMGGQRV